MNHRRIFVALATAVLLLGSNVLLALESKTNETGRASGKAQASTKGPTARQSDIAAGRKAAAKIKLVNINSASAEQLKKLASIGAAAAARIIAGRPYGSKAWLVTHNIIPDGAYENLKMLIVAGPLEDATKNAAFLESLKKP